MAGVVKEITYPNQDGINSSAEAKKKSIQTNRGPNEKRRQMYIDAGYTNKVGDAYFYDKAGNRTRVRYDGSLDIPENSVGGYEGDITASKLAEFNNKSKAMETSPIGGTVINSRGTANGGQTAGTTVPQRNQKDVANQSGANAQGGITVGPYNANLNYYQYGDDSAPAQQGQRGGMNEKYTGTGVKNSNLEYDPNITTADLDPDYFYGELAKAQNRKEAGYIARRNDMIASALYNEGKVSREDVEQFLSTQNEWLNSTEDDRLNTIESVWKRLGEIAQEQPEQPQEQYETPDFGDELQDQEGVIYGRASGNKDSRIETNADPYSPDAVSLRQREANYKSLQAMSDYDIALLETSGVSLYGETAMRDLATYDPGKYQRIQEQKKLIQQGEMVNAIASGETGAVTTQTKNATNTVNSSVDTWINQNSTARNSGQVQEMITNSLANSQVAQTATQEMLNLQRQMAEIESKLENLPKTVKSQFKGDVPQYLIDAKVANEGQRLQAELSKLQSRYNGAIELYKTELAQKQWEEEMKLKKSQFESDNNYRNREMTYKNKQLALSAQDQAWNQNYMNTKLKYDQIKEINGEPYVLDATTGKWTKLSDDIAYQTYMTDTKDKLNTYLKMFPDGSTGGQCEAFTDAFTYSTTGLKMEGAGGRAYTTVDEKIGYVNTWIPEVGSVAVFDWGIKQSDGVNYGHTMLVSGYDPSTGIITLTGSNRSSKDGQYEKVYTQQMTLDKLNNLGAFKGFWNPYLDKVAESYDSTEYNPYYSRANTPMTSIINQLKTNASTQGQLTQISVGEMMYNTMYELEADGYLDALIESGVVQDFINGLDRKNFGKQGDERGSAFLEQLGIFLRNEIKDERVAYALNRLYALVEQKLRQESGAAISSSEWAMDFQLFLPQPGQSEALRKKQLQTWDDLIMKEFSATGMPSSKYVPIFDYSDNGSVGSGRETW